MSGISFKSFALAKGFSLPVSAIAVAKSLNLHSPVSIRAMIATAAPFVPSSLSYASLAWGIAAFTWSDPAAPPLGINRSPIPYGLRHPSNLSSGPRPRQPSTRLLSTMLRCP